MIEPGRERRRIAHALNAAYADGLLSRDTLVRRLDHLLRARLIDPRRLVGDLYRVRVSWSDAMSVGG
jgi:hypothetical protein